MERIIKDWISAGWMDQEYKEYLLLAWLQKVKKEFRNTLLYPGMSELIDQYRNLKSLEQNRFDLSGNTKEISGIDMHKMRLIYKELDEKPELDAYLDSLLYFSLPKIEEMIREGRDIYEWANEQLDFVPVGMMPLYQNEGYLFLYTEPVSELSLYRYQLSAIQIQNEPHRMLETELVDQKRKKLSETFEQIKLDLTRRFRELPNPATFLVKSTHLIPLNETFLPIAKRKLLQKLASDAA